VQDGRVKPVEITSDGLLLRPWRPGDADAVFRACQDPEIQRWTTVPSPYLRDHANDFVARFGPTAFENDAAAAYAVCDAATGALLGSCGLIFVDLANRTAEVGYWTAAWARGRGVATAATRAVARWAVDDLGLRRIVAHAAVGNHASALVARRAGFAPEGIARSATADRTGDPVDLWVAALVDTDLDGPQPPSDPVAARRAAIFARPQPVLFATTRSGEIRLRALEERDIDAVTQGARDPETIRWTTVPDPYRRRDAEVFVHEYGPGVWSRGAGALFGIGDPADDAYRGVIELRLSASDPAVADVGFAVAPWARGRGFAPAALAAVTGWGFTALGLTRIEWRANVGNTASRRVAEKAGFRFEGTARAALNHRGKRVDAWVGAVLSTDAPGEAT
jgi:RimJ/RimL family protein N-acetyltransferase